MKAAFRSRSCLCGWVVIYCAIIVCAQSSSTERTFSQSKAEIEKALRSMQSNMGGRLPVLDGFAKPGEHPLDQYQRGYYQATAEVVENPSGGVVVRIKAKVTAWYSHASSSHSGYQLLASNGRLETDLLDQLAEKLAVNAPARNESTTAAAKVLANDDKQASPQDPAPKFPAANGSALASPAQWASRPTTENKAAGSSQKGEHSLKAEAENLEELLKNTSHPRNLVAIRKSGTPVVSTPSLTGKPLFLASLHDEFELLDFNADWVHVRISGLSRGWIWRNSVEMPEGIPDTEASSSSGTSLADLFRVVREEVAPFPGDWEPLRGKSVKIISVQKIDERAKNVGLSERLEYAKFLLDKGYSEITEKKQAVEGIVVIFDSADGGMIAATTPALQQWRAGTLTDAALWHKCFFDPPETLDVDGPSGGK